MFCSKPVTLFNDIPKNLTDLTAPVASSVIVLIISLCALWDALDVYFVNKV